jgi:hypothetical protein
MADGTLKVGTITTSSGSGTITLGQSGETVDMANGSITLNSSMKMTPAWFVSSSSAQSISDNTDTKVTLDTELFDTDNAFASNKFTCPSGQDGKYFVYASIDFILTSANDMKEVGIRFYKNGSAHASSFVNGYGNANFRRFVINSSMSISLTAGDYLELFGYQDSASGAAAEMRSNNGVTYFGGNRIIGA